MAKKPEFEIYIQVYYIRVYSMEVSQNISAENYIKIYFIICRFIAKKWRDNSQNMSTAAVQIDTLVIYVLK